MNADSTYFIGKDHTVCEDYTLAGTLQDRITFAVVCDGCSASADVDFGARVLAMAARETFQYKLSVEDGLFPGISPELSPDRFGLITINKATEVCRSFRHLHPQALDATLLTAWVQNNKVTAYLYGDGVLVHRKVSGEIVKVHIQLSSGAPDYLSYTLEKPRLEGYKAVPNNKKEIIILVNDKRDTREYVPLTPFVYNADVMEGDVISVISDGINSFRKANNDSIPWTDLVEEFTGYKNFEGEFVQRRIAAFKRKCLKEGITHSDDISVASIVVG